MSRANKKLKEVFILIFEDLGPAFTFAVMNDGTFKDQTQKVTIKEKDTKFEKKKDTKFEYLKVPKRENFSLSFFALSEPIWICDLGTGGKNRIFSQLTPDFDGFWFFAAY